MLVIAGTIPVKAEYRDEARKLARMMEEETRDDSSDASRLVQVRELAEALAAFAEERDWNQYHSPKNLVMALSGEVGELSEIFQWMTEDASREGLNNVRA